MNLRFGMRDDAVSRARATRVADALRAALAASPSKEAGGVAVVAVTIAEEADRAGADPELLVAALRVALISGECDAVIYDAASLPLKESADLKVAAFLPAREARLAFVSAGTSLQELEDGAIVLARDGRIAAQVARLREGLVTEVDPGDVRALLARVEHGEAAAAVVALCDVELDDVEPAFLSVLGVDEVVPPAGQGVVTIEIRADAPDDIASILTALDDAETRQAVTAERAVLRGLAEDPEAPACAHATRVGDDLRLHVRVTNRSGTLVLNDESHGPASDPEFLGSNAARLLLGRGAERLMRMA